MTSLYDPISKLISSYRLSFSFNHCMASLQCQSVHISFNSHFYPCAPYFNVKSLYVYFCYLDRCMTSFKCEPIHMRFGSCLTIVMVSLQYEPIFICLSPLDHIWLHCFMNQCIYAFVPVLIAVTVSLFHQ